MKQHHNQFIRCIENIQDLSGQKLYEYAMLLGGGFAHSKKTIKYISKTKKYSIVNHIDNSKESLTEKDFKKTLIFKAMAKRALIAIID